jgi:hypothetical protein
MDQRTISRRSLLRGAVLGLAGVTVGFHPFGARAFGAAMGTLTTAAATGLHLTMRECLVEMVDETRVYMWAYDSPQAGLRVPGPVIYAVAGTDVELQVTNALPHVHAFAIPGIVDSGPIEPGQTVVVAFTAPAAGTYLYLDPMNAPVNRAMGLGGTLIVLPSTSGRTPYDQPTEQVANLFDDLGRAYWFPGQRWKPERSWLWVFSSVDPAMHTRVWDDPGLSPDEFVAEYLPTYFLLNGRTGFFAANDDATAIHGRIGQPALVRVANLGMMTSSPHVHGNHVYVLAVDTVVQDNVIAHDTFEMVPLATTDVLLPFVRPPDAHPWPPSDPSIWTTDLAGDGHRGLVYPMHCHAELSQLANGGNYPQGLITHWTIEGDVVDPDPDEPPEEPPEEPPGEEPPEEPPGEEPPEEPPGEEPPPGPGKGKGRPEDPGKPDKPKPEPPRRP